MSFGEWSLTVDPLSDSGRFLKVIALKGSLTGPGKCGCAVCGREVGDELEDFGPMDGENSPMHWGSEVGLGDKAPIAIVPTPSFQPITSTPGS